jgi:hypothetical protein
MINPGIVRKASSDVKLVPTGHSTLRRLGSYDEAGRATEGAAGTRPSHELPRVPSNPEEIVEVRMIAPDAGTRTPCDKHVITGYTSGYTKR